MVKPKNGWYQAKNPADGSELSGNVRMKDTLKKEFWDNILEKTDFATALEEKYKVAYRSILDNNE